MSKPRPLAIITGASRGIGHATAQAFHDDGWEVVGISRSSCASFVRHIVADLADPDFPAAVGPAVLDAASGAAPLCLVHNAAVLDSDTAVDVDARRFAEVLQLNVIAAAQLNQLLRPQMRDGSSILYVGSTLGTKAVAGVCSYVVSKHAVTGLMRATCQDLAGSGIHTACVCPGFTDTEMLRDRAGNDDAVLESLASGVAFGRLAEPGEIAAVLRFCADNPVLNGALIDANLGQIER